MPSRPQKTTVIGGEKRSLGRPPADNPKATIISLRLAATDTANLDGLVALRGGGRSAVIRDLIAEEHARRLVRMR
jgi:hypothetical protein